MAEENISIKMGSTLLERIMAFAKSKEMNRSEAIKHLIDLGLKLNDIREDKSSDLEEEFRKLSLEIYVRIMQQYLYDIEAKDKDKLLKISDNTKRKIESTYPLIFENFKEFLYPKKE